MYGSKDNKTTGKAILSTFKVEKEDETKILDFEVVDSDNVCKRIPFTRETLEQNIDQILIYLEI